MAKPTVKDLQAQIATLSAENEQLRTLCAEWAQDSKRLKLTILKLQDRLPASAPSTAAPRPARNASNPRRDAAIAHCAHYGVASASPADIDAWMESHKAA